MMRLTSGLFTGLFLTSAACHEPPPPVVPPVTSALAPPPPPAAPANGLSGEIVAPAGSAAKGRIALTWRTADEDEAVRRGSLTLALVRRMIDRMTVGAEVDLAATPRVRYELAGAPSDAVAVAFLDVDHTFWETFQGGGKGLVGASAPGGGPLALAPPRSAPSPGVERCSGERKRLVLVEDQELGRRRFCAYLPPSWSATSKRRYPVILLLPGFGSTDLSYLVGRRNAGERFDVIASALGREAVLVGVDTAVPLGSTYFEDTPPMGAWETFFLHKALPTLERELHLLPRRTARAVMGQSTGGYNALSLGLRHSDVFAAVGASSPDALDVERWLLQPGTRRPHDWLRNWQRIEETMGGAGQFTSWAASWSPDSTAARGFRYPIDVESGTVNEEVLARWVARTPHGLVRDPARVARLKKDLDGRIMIIVGRNDEFGLFAPAESFARELDALGVSTRFEPTDHGHADHLDRFEPTYRFLLERLDRAEGR